MSHSLRELHCVQSVSQSACSLQSLPCFLQSNCVFSALTSATSNTQTTNSTSCFIIVDRINNIIVVYSYHTTHSPFPSLLPPKYDISRVLIYANMICVAYRFQIDIEMDNDNGKDNKNIVEYLLTQNRKLKDEVSDLRELVQMNKIEIDVLSKNNTSNKYIEVIANYRLAVENYQKKLEAVQAKIEEVISEKLVLQQLNQQANVELKALEALHKDRTQSLQQIIKDLEQKLLVLEKNEKSYDTLTGFVERTKEVFNPTQQSVHFKEREQEMKEEIHLLKLQIKKGKENEDNLLKINGILRHKVVTLQAKLAMPNKNLGEILDKSLKRLMMYFIETQKRILTGEESDSEGQEDLELIAPQLSTYFGDQTTRRQNTYNVPHLDLLKIRGSIANGNIKIKEELVKRNHLTKEEKIERLQIELEYTRRELTRNIIDLREEIDRRKALQKICDEFQARNQILTSSYKQLAQKLNKYTRKVKESKEKQLKFIELDETINDMSTTIIKYDNNYIDLQRAKPTAEPQRKTNQNFQIYESPEQYKIHLELLAKDLAKNKKIQNLEHMRNKEEGDQEEWKPRLKRSTSNPFLYFNERRQEIMEIKDTLNTQNIKKSNHHGRMRLEQTQIFGQGLNMMPGRGEDLDDIVI